MSSWLRVVQRYSILLFFTSAFPSYLYSQITIKIWNPTNSIGGNKNWDNQFNWIEIGFPSSSELAKFENATDSTFISTSEAVTGLIMNGNTIAGTGSISVSDSMNWNGGRLVGNGSLTLQPNATVRINGDVVVDGWTVIGSGNIDLETGTSIVGSGWIVVSDTLDVTGTVSVAKLELKSTGIVTGTGTIEITDSLKWDGATIAGGGTLKILNSAVLTLTGNEGALNGWILNNAGTLVQQVDLSLNSGTLTNSGVYELHASILSSGGTNLFTNSGTLNVGAGAGSIGVPFNTSGSVNVQGGSVDIVGGGTAAGVFTLGEGDSILFVEAGSTFDGPTFSGLGWLYVDNAVTATGNISIGKFDFTGYGGSLAGSAIVEVTDSMRWGGGRLSGTGELIISTGATMVTIPGDYQLTLADHTLTNNGTVLQSISLEAGGNAQINNNGIYKFTSSGFANPGMYLNSSNPGSAAFNNLGSFLSSTELEAEVQIPFNNSGSVDVLDGMLSLEAGGTSSGTFSIIDTASLVFPSGFYQMNTGTGSSGAGYLTLDGGTLYLGGNVTMAKFNVDSGIVEGAGYLAILDTLKWGSGTLGGGGEVIISANGVLLITAGLRAGSRDLNARTLNNQGTVVQWANFNVKYLANVLNSGTYRLMGNHVVVADTSAGFFHNLGNFEKLTVPLNGGSDGRVEIVFQNDANLMVEQSSELELTGDFPNLIDRALTGGDYVIYGTFIIPGYIDTNYAYITLSGGSILDSSGNSALSTFHMNKGGFTLDGGSFLTINDSLTNEGEFTIESGCSLSVLKFTQAAGNTWFRSGPTGGLNPNGSIVDVTGGSFYGNGTIYGALHNSANLFIGEEIGRLSVSSFAQTPEGILHIDIRGTSPAEDHDQLSLPGGLATLDGTMKAKLVDGFVPSAGNSIFGIVEHEGRNGTFDAVVDLNPGDGIRLIADYASNAVTNLIANFAPLFTQTLPDTTIDENQTLTFPFLAGDPEDSSFFFSVLSPLQGVSVDSATGSFSWTPNFDQSGVHEIVVGVSDAFETTLDTVIVTVLHVNRLPLFTNILPDTTIAEGQELMFTIAGADPDLDSLAFEIVEGSEGSILSADSGFFSWTPSYSDSGSHTIVVSLGDGIGTVLDTAIVVVSNTNVPPLFVLNLPDTTVLENATLSFTVTGYDFDLNALTFGKVAGPVGLSISAAGEVEWATTYDDSGTYSVVLSLFDGIATVLDTATVIVSNVNRIPILVNAVRDTSIAENDTLSLTVDGIDLDNDLLLFDLVQAPIGADISAVGEFTWTPSFADSGSHTVVISIGDGMGEILDTVTVFVSNTNVPPAFVLGLPDTTIQENSALSFTVTGSDFDLNLLSFAKYEGPAALNVSSGGDVAWTTSHGDSGTHTVVISLSDGFTSVLDTASIIVANVNQLPSLVQSLPDTMIAEAQTLLFTVSAVDPDSDPVSFSMVSGPEGADITTGGLFSWTPTYSDSGSHTIIVSVGDGFDSVHDTAAIIVTNVNRLPVFTAIPDTSVSENDTLEFMVAATDPDGSPLNFTLIAGPSGASLTSGGLFSWRPSFLQAGIDTIVVGVNDGLDGVADTALITVFNVNRSPGNLSLLSPVDGDTVQLALPLTVDFRWSKAIDLDSDDTLRYLVRILGPVLDTTVVVETDTSVSIDLGGRLQSSADYTWNVRVTDRSDTVNAQQEFSFRTSATITAIADPGTLPVEFALSQNYPNPFNPSTTIAYDLPSQSLVTVQIFNMIGQLVSTLVETEQPAGRYSVTWRGTSESRAPVSSGIYFYRIHAKSNGLSGEFIQTRKLMLIK